jgi:putative membrane protein
VTHDAAVGRRLKDLFVAWLVLAGAVMITVALLPGLEVDWSPGTYMAIAAVFALVNLFLGPMLRLLSFPVMVATLGLFAFVINTGLFLLTAWFMDSFHVETLWAALGGSVVISLVRAALMFLVDRRS